MKTLVIAEKPDMGRNIAAVIEPKAQNKRSYLEGEHYIITWAIGHLIGLAEPDLYDEKYKKWRFGDLPIIPDNFKLLPNPRTKDQLQVIADLAARSGELVNACDAGREGQHIFSLIVRHLGLQHPVKRLWISDLTAETIRKGFDQLKDNAEYANLTQAARARSEADWLIGMNGSRAFTTKHNELLSVGRVQTPVLALIYDRQKQIEAFDSLKFYEIAATFEQSGSAPYRGNWQGDRLTDPEKAKAIADKVRGKTGAIASYEVKDTKEYPFKLYDLTLLQREANGKFGFSAKKTLDVAQALYEKHKIISYPRTNSNYVNAENIPEMHKILDAMRNSPEYGDFVNGANKRFVHANNKNVCNPAKVEDHHAIMPTMRKPQGLSPDERKLYDLVVKRFLSHFYPAAEYKVHTVLTEVEKETFKTTVKQLLSLGWKVIYAGDAPAAKGGGKEKGKEKDDGAAEEEEQETDAPFEVDPQKPVVCADAEVKEKETQPPKPYTEGTLLKAMESAGKQIEDEELRDAMKDSGLGTPATRAATIERLKQVGYIDMQGKRIVITPKGRTAVELIRGAGIELLTSPEMTGHWERRLTEISRGQASAEAFMGNVKKFTRLIIDKVNVQRPAARNAFARPEPAAKGARGGKKASGGGETGGSVAVAAKKSPAKRASAPKTSSAEQSGEPVVIGVCPSPGCGGNIFMGRKGYGCSHYKTGCKFVIWKESLGRTLTDAMVKALIGKGRTGKLKFPGTGGGEAFEARIVLKNDKTGELALERE
ncbi:DNA topoisomerase III [Cohnella sp. CIP 111063]|uniref:type IA DNA topoisomerase n=1 Tax=unclassified Cohnella TaxID=2636738 RepID=UPI000B8C5496|nr:MULTISPECIES: type IA DNA topoisomerase [unclassified Cohnella]OXS60552.1 DNA topoisomerase III [Cohnella sp. CIP 111063]